MLTGLAFVCAAFATGSVSAMEKIEAKCHLTYKKTVDAKGPCTIMDDGKIVSIKGTVEENGQKYTAVIDNAKNEGLLIGAGTFGLADGKLEKNEALEVVWPNGYMLKIER